MAAAFSAEVGDFTRFRSGRQVTAYFGLAPSQRSSGDSVRLGGISGAGNALVRKLAVEGSWCYAAARHQPKLMPRDTGVPLEIRMHGRKGSERLLRRREGMLARGMPQAKANAATAAELVRWLWALVSVNIFFTIFTNVFSPIAPTRMRRIRQRGCAAFGV